MRGAHSKQKKKSAGKVGVDVLSFFAVVGMLVFLLAVCLTFPLDDSTLSDSSNEFSGAIVAPVPASNEDDDSVASAFGLQTRETYKNQRFGFSVDVPVAFILGSEIDDGAGVILVSSLLRMTVKVDGYNNDDNLDARAVADQLWKHAKDSIVRTEGNRVVIYQYDREYEYFIWAYVGSGSINQMTIRYPLQDDNQEELVAAQMLMQNFRPGALDTPH